MDNYCEITTSAETDLDHSAGFDPSVSQSKSSHFVTKSPAIHRGVESGYVQNPIPDFIIGFLGF